MSNSLVKSLSEAETYVNTTNSKLSCKVATTANITLSGTQTIDGVSVGVGNRVLVKNQSTESEHGIYICRSAAWTRSEDMNSNETCRPNSFVFISSLQISLAIGAAAFEPLPPCSTTILKANRGLL